MRILLAAATAPEIEATMAWLNESGPTDGWHIEPLITGVGLMAAVDEIVFHQLLGWHHFYDRSTSEVGLMSDGFLHAAELSFDHPVSGERVTFDSPLPADLAELLSRLEPTGGR